MADSASIWMGQQQLIPVANSFGNVFEEWKIATASQTVFVISSFQYTPGTNTLMVFRNGIFQQVGTAYLETNSTTVTWLTPTTAGDKIAFFAFATEGVAIPNGGGVPAGGATGQVLTKIDGSDYNTNWTTISALASLLDSPISTVPSATTVDLSALTTVTRNIVISGNVNIAGFQISRGQLFAARFSGTLTLQNSANLVTQRNRDISIVSGDTCFIRATADNVVEILAYSGPGTLVSSNNYTFRNKIQNGDFKINQRGGVTITASGGFPVDQWVLQTSSAATCGLQAFSGGFAPGLPSVLRFTATASTSPAAGSYWLISQGIEGSSIASLRWGTGGAQPITVSFWVKCSITGTFSIALQNHNNTRSYIAPFTINAANVGEYKTLVIPGDGAGTWNTDNTLGMLFNIVPAVGTTRQTAAGVWTAGNFFGFPGQTQLVQTNGANMELSGLQLEIGTIATAFEELPTQVALALCQRHAYVITGNGLWCPGQALGASTVAGAMIFPVNMRTTPIAIFNAIGAIGPTGTLVGATTAALGLATSQAVTINMNMSSAAFTAGQSALVTGTVAGAYVIFQAPLV